MKYNILTGLSILIMSSCSTSAPLDLALKLAGENRAELENVLTYYSAPEDSLKYRAACFLIENMPYHFAKIGYEQNQYDITHVKSKFLIKNIELAFKVWQKPWAREVPFDVFCRYILPYRAQVEPLTGLREELMNRYLALPDSAGATTPFEACKAINEQLRKELRYQATGSPFYPSIEETWSSGIGQCDGLCNLGIHIMRAAGIPVAVDYTPVWTKMDLGHSWCAVWDNGRFHSFGPGEQHPDEHLVHLQTVSYLKPVKVYRKCFDFHGETDPLDDGFVTYLKNPTSYDVTSEYWDEPVAISVESHSEFEKKHSPVYLCTHNQGEWMPLAAGKRDGNMCTVPDVYGADNVFILADSPDGRELRYITPPFYVDTAGTVQELIPDFSRKDSVGLPNNEYNRKNMALTYWNPDTDRFEELSDFNEADTMTFYRNIPGNALLRFSGKATGLNQHRVFFLKNDGAIAENDKKIISQY